MSKIKNIPNFELCQQLKAAGYPQPLSEFGQFWYTEPDGCLCIGANSGSRVRPGDPYLSAKNGIGASITVSGYAYAPTVMEMAEYSKGRSNWQIKELFKLWADGEPTRQNIANDMAGFVLWLIEWRKERDEYKAKKDVQEKEKAEKERMHWQNIFESGNVILVCFGRDGDNVQDMLVLGHDFGVEHVKLQNKEGVSFWKKRKHVFVKSILANINRPIDPSVSHLVETFLPAGKTGNIENEHIAQTGTITKSRFFVAGEKLKPGEVVFVTPDNKIMKSDGATSPTRSASK